MSFSTGITIAISFAGIFFCIVLFIIICQVYLVCRYGYNDPYAQNWMMFGGRSYGRAARMQNTIMDPAFGQPYYARPRPFYNPGPFAPRPLYPGPFYPGSVYPGTMYPGTMYPGPGIHLGLYNNPLHCGPSGLIGQAGH